MRRKFKDVTKDCFRSNDLGNWNSELCVGATPIEFALAMDDSGSMSLRYVTDPQCRPGSLEEAKRTIENIRSVIALSARPASELLARLSHQHLVDTGGLPKTHFVHGFRFSRDERVFIVFTLIRVEKEA